MIRAVLPDFLKYECVDGLIRIGQQYDGGYLVLENDVVDAGFLLSFGVCDDWSFETDFVGINDVPVLAYDGSVGAGYFLFRAIKELKRVDKPWKIKRAWKKYFSFKRFFRNSHRHVEKFVGGESGPDRVSIKEIFDSVPSDRIFLNVDIEAGEYEILDEIVKQQERLTGLAMEFHDCPQHLDEIRSFVQGFGLPIVHIHANNYSPVDESHMPHVLEITFGKRLGPSSKTCSLPHPLDMPNNPVGEEIQISFAG